jgi:hypothetical protein
MMEKKIQPFTQLKKVFIGEFQKDSKLMKTTKPKKVKEFKISTALSLD